MKKLLSILLLIPSILFGQLGTVPVSGGFAGYYHFDGNSNDATSNANNGTASNITYSLSNGKYNQGALCNGTTGSITANGLVTALATSTTGTISFWANNLEVTNTQCLTFDITTASGNLSTIYINFDWRTANKKFQIICIKDAVTQFDAVSSTNSLTTLAGSYHNFVITHDVTSSSLYIDGLLKTLTFNTSTDKTAWFKTIITDATNKATLGYLVYGPSPYKGNLDELIIETSKTWSASEVRRYYTQSLGRFSPK